MATAFELTDSDRHILSLTDDQFILHDWDNLVSIIGNSLHTVTTTTTTICTYISVYFPARNDLDALKRKPSDLARYLAWSSETKAQYGSVSNFIHQCRLKWADATTTTPSNPIPFADPSDYKILRNDWPYGVAPGIVHLVVWLRTPIPAREDNGDLTDESRRLIEEFVGRTFVARLGARSQVLWFKNWSALQTIRTLEHFHVLLRNVPEGLLLEWTGE